MTLCSTNKYKRLCVFTLNGRRKKRVESALITGVASHMKGELSYIYIPNLTLLTNAIDCTLFWGLGRQKLNINKGPILFCSHHSAQCRNSEMSFTEQNLIHIYNTEQEFTTVYFRFHAENCFAIKLENQGTDGLVLKNSKYITDRQQVLQYHSMCNTIKMKIQQGTLLLMPA